MYILRTDSGVHAIRSGVHVDLPPFKGKFLAPHAIQDYLNRKFLKQNLNLRLVANLSARY